MKSLLELVYTPKAKWDESARAAFEVDLKARYPRVGEIADRRFEQKNFQLRVNSDASEGAVPYAALIAPEQERSGPYGGMSFVLFPSDDPGHPAGIAMGVGTNGLAPDEAILGSPGHARKCAAIAKWLNKNSATTFAWAKRDPVRIDLSLPSSVRDALESFPGAREKYGNVLYMVFVPPAERTTKSDQIVTDALTALIDLFFDDRGIYPKAGSTDDCDRIRRAWLAGVLPNLEETEVTTLLESRRFVVIEGPPGTGKTELARRVLAKHYKGRGRIVQFHPGTTYESFIGGLAPREGAGTTGLLFRPALGHLMESALEAMNKPNERFLLVIDEINRADLSKVLGEAIFLFEPKQPDREIQLQYDFSGFGRSFKLPPNLDIVGTMNSADRSIAILDIAVRRRFAFVPLWPQVEVVEKVSGDALQQAFHRLLMIFVNHASEDALPLMPGHSYFLGTDAEAKSLLATGVRPLLEEYLAQGYVAGFADEIRAYIDFISQSV